jgi:hypothetical protein
MKLNARMLFVVLALTLSSTYSVAQNYPFKVLAVSGNPEIKKTNAWSPLRSGASLLEADEVRLGKNAYIGLIHTTGRSRELMKAGTYKIKDLASNMGSGSTVMDKYFDFILSKNSDEAKQNRLVAVGSVTRDAFKEDILVNLPENKYADILNNKVILRWESKADSVGPFIVTIRNLSDDELLTIETTTPTVPVDFSGAELKNESFFLVKVTNKKDSRLASASYLIKRLQQDDQKKFMDQISSISNEMKDESAMKKIVLAGFYETNLLLIDATVAYEEAIQLAPGVDFYQEAYEEFLLRNSLKFPKE